MATVRPTTVLAATAGVGIAAFVGYAIYFDHRRRTDVEFRKALKREARREARLAKDQAQEQSKRQQEDIRRLYQQSEEEGFPTGDKEQEDYFMTMIQEGEELSRAGDLVEAAYSFYRALKVYPSQRDLVNIYDKTVAKPVLDILAEFIAMDSSIRVDAPAGAPGSIGTRSGSSVKSGGDSVHGVDD